MAERGACDGRPRPLRSPAERRTRRPTRRAWFAADPAVRRDDVGLLQPVEAGHATGPAGAARLELRVEDCAWLLSDNSGYVISPALTDRPRAAAVAKIAERCHVLVGVTPGR